VLRPLCATVRGRAPVLLVAGEKHQMKIAEQRRQRLNRIVRDHALDDGHLRARTHCPPAAAQNANTVGVVPIVQNVRENIGIAAARTDVKESPGTISQRAHSRGIRVTTGNSYSTAQRRVRSQYRGEPSPSPAAAVDDAAKRLEVIAGHNRWREGGGSLGH
jgi:hypothetical protein